MQLKRSLLGLLSLFLALLLSACSNNEESQPQQDEVKSTAGIAVPEGIRNALLPATGTLTAKVYVGSNANPTQSKTIAVTDTIVNFTIKLSPGTYTFTIVFEYDDTVFTAQTWELARAVSDPVNVTNGSTQTAVFPVYTYQDFDTDGITNLAELDESMRTDPGDNTCTLDASMLDSCVLG